MWCAGVSVAMMDGYWLKIGRVEKLCGGVECRVFLEIDRHPWTSTCRGRSMSAATRHIHHHFVMPGAARGQARSASRTDWWQGKYAAIAEARWQAPLKSHSNSSSLQFVKRTRKKNRSPCFFFQLFLNLWELFIPTADRSVSSED